MQKIAIDLLPEEFRVQERKKTKFYKIQFAGIALILLTIFLSSLTVALRILQSQQSLQIQTRTKEAEQKISNLKTTQASLLLLKNRLITINQYLGTPSKQAQIYNLVERLMSASSSITTLSVSKSGEVLVVAAAPDGRSLDNLIDSLTSKESNEDKIKKVGIESLSRGRDGAYRLSFKITPK